MSDQRFFTIFGLPKNTIEYFFPKSKTRDSQAFFILKLSNNYKKPPQNP
ncbi:hypothetical protein FEM08_03530 [Flavobacterium gilvum]|nr:hypothetical protein FEM08_03530 [Flavobacterium gilvum]